MERNPRREKVKSSNPRTQIPKFARQLTGSRTPKIEKK